MYTRHYYNVHTLNLLHLFIIYILPLIAILDLPFEDTLPNLAFH